MVVGEFLDGALDHTLREGLGSRSVRAGGNPEVVDVSGRGVVDETCRNISMGQPREKKSRLTVDVNRLEGSAGVIATLRGGGSAVLSRVGRPVLCHFRAVDDVGHRILHVLFDESTEGGVGDVEGAGGGVVRVGFAERHNLLAEYTQAASVPNSGHQRMSGKLACYSPSGVHIGGTDRVNPVLNRTAHGVVVSVRPRRHRGQNTAASIVAHNDDVLDAQRLDTVR